MNKMILKLCELYQRKGFLECDIIWVEDELSGCTKQKRKEIKEIVREITKITIAIKKGLK